MSRGDLKPLPCRRAADAPPTRPASPLPGRAQGRRRRPRRLAGRLRAAHRRPRARPQGARLLDYQPEFRTPIWDYLAGLVDDERVADGQAMLKQWRDTLAAVAARYRVDPATVVAVGRREQLRRNFGSPLLTSLSTLSCYGRRRRTSAASSSTPLKIVDAGDVKREQLTGSWAGAFGHTQFMPSTFLRLAVDFDGDGRRDLVGSVPTRWPPPPTSCVKPAGATTSPGAYEVRLPAGFDASSAGRKQQAAALSAWSPAVSPASTAARWRARAALARCCPPAARARPSRCSATSTRSTATTPPRATRWPSPTCPTACAAAALRYPWPTDDAGLSRAERREVQTLLSPAATPSAPSTACSATPAGRRSASSSSASATPWTAAPARNSSAPSRKNR